MNIYAILSLILTFMAIVVSICLHLNKKRHDQSIADDTSRIEKKMLQNETELQLYKIYDEIKKQKPDILDSTNGVGRNYLAQYFELCQDWFFYHEDNSVSDEAWERWVNDMRQNFQKQCYSAFWRQPDKDYDIRFLHFVYDNILDVK